MNKLIIVTLLLVATAGANANEYKYGCSNSSAYKGDSFSSTPAEFGGTTTATCKAFYEMWQGSGQNLNGMTVDNTTTCATFTTTEAKSIAKVMGKYCCDDGKSVCFVDYSKLCADPTKYTGSKETSKFGNAVACDSLMEIWDAPTTGPFSGTTWSTVSKCDDITNTIKDANGGPTGQPLAQEVANECCSDAVGVCEATALDNTGAGVKITSMPKVLLFALLFIISSHLF